MKRGPFGGGMSKVINATLQPSSPYTHIHIHRHKYVRVCRLCIVRMSLSLSLSLFVCLCLCAGCVDTHFVDVVVGPQIENMAAHFEPQVGQPDIHPSIHSTQPPVRICVCADV